MKQRQPKALIYYGSKTALVPKLLRLLPPHRVYVEPFGGAATLLFAKPPSELEVYADIDEGLVTYFRVLQDRERLTAFLRQVLFIPHSRQEYRALVKQWAVAQGLVEKATIWLTVTNQSYNGIWRGGWAPRIKHRFIDYWFFHRRLQGVIIEQADFRETIPRYDSPETLFYCDPPYIKDTRGKKRAYLHEMSDKDHEELVALLLQVKGKVILSGYDHPNYAPLEQAGWVKLTFPVACFAKPAEKREVRWECLWLSPSIPVQQQRGIMPVQGTAAAMPAIHEPVLQFSHQEY